MDAYLTVSELAELLKMQEQTIRRWILKREIPYCKIKRAVRFRPSEIEKWVDEGGLEAAQKNEKKRKKRVSPSGEEKGGEA
jgi:excisionase family DNA binding protein